jgi:hypothetical protein
MKAQVNINKMMQGTKRYWYEDGFQDLVMGGWMLILGLALAAQSLTPPNSILGLAWTVAVPLLLIGGGLAAGWAINQFKTRITFPRTGYVSYEHDAPSKSGNLRIIAVMLVAAAVAPVAILASKQAIGMTGFFGVAFMAVFGYLAWRFGLRRHLVLALVSLALGLALSFAPLTMEQSSPIFFVGFGFAMMLAGWFAWRQYDHNAPPPMETDNAENSRP